MFKDTLFFRCRFCKVCKILIYFINVSCIVKVMYNNGTRVDGSLF